MSDKPKTTMVLARDVVPYAWALWSDVEGSMPFENEIVGVRWSEDGQYLWFMLDSGNFLKADPDDLMDLVPYRSKYRTDETVERDVVEHARVIVSQPFLASCATCRHVLTSEAGVEIDQVTLDAGYPARMMTLMNTAAYSKQLSHALSLADEYRLLTARGDVARLAQIRGAIDELVGTFVDGKLTIPRSVSRAMGRGRK